MIVLPNDITTKYLKLQSGALTELPEVFTSLYGSATASLIADENTFNVAGKQVYDSLKRAGINCSEPLIFSGNISAEYSLVEQTHRYIDKHNAMPVAVGSGTINDLVKLASHQSARPYIVAATAASMDGYTSYGASITFNGSKQTFECPAPQAVIADLDILINAPENLNASGYGDLFAKKVAGADWILADGLSVEPINHEVWNMVQLKLHDWLDNPSRIQERSPDAINNLMKGLLSTGLAMQVAKSSRPASGAEHQFSHLWDMQNQTQEVSPSSPPLHGFKVAIGSLASIAMYERLFDVDIESLNISSVVSIWPDRDTMNNEIDSLFDIPAIRDKAREESMAKYIDRSSLADQLELLKKKWGSIRQKLQHKWIEYNVASKMLSEAGCPVTSEQIGISNDRLKQSYKQAYHIRRRFTILDLARRVGINY